jgi:hypothetical protein
MMMPHARYRTGMSILGFLLFTLAPGFTAPAMAQDAMPKRCTGCHTESSVVERVAKIPAQERRAKLEAFLANHHTPDAAERAAIARALAENAGTKP